MIEALSVLGAVLLFIAAVFEVLLIAGLPLGEFTMGGRHKVLPPAMRAAGAGSLLTQVFAGFFVINTAMNFFSTSKKEKYTMTPLALIEAVCFLLTAVYKL